MTLRRSLLGAASAALTILLIVADKDQQARSSRDGSTTAKCRLDLLRQAGLIDHRSQCISPAKNGAVWMPAFRRASDSAPSRTMSFALTGTGAGARPKVLPVQLSMSAARTLGAYFYGRSLKRGTGGTLFEQSFDVLIVGFLVVASAATRFYGGAGAMWTRYARFPWPRWRFL